MQPHAESLLHGDGGLIADLAKRFIVPEANNFVERPWGGMRIREFKRLCALPDQLESTGFGLGEAFELAAFDDDDEARAHPSLIRLDDGSTIPLPELLRRHGPALLGADFVARYGACLPLLPKTLDVKELLSVQGHPAGNVEAYIIIAADPGATIRLGFSQDIDARALKQMLDAGLRRQRDLVGLLPDGTDLNALQQQLQGWLADRAAGDPRSGLPDALVGAFEWPAAGELLVRLKEAYWGLLDKLNALPVSAGQVIYNATPARVVEATGHPIGAEVHALGNPERLEILALEVRRPGPTFRAWDNVRFPIRPVDVDAAIDALNLHRTAPSEFIVEPVPVPGRPGAYRSIESDFFTVEHLRPSARTVVDVPAGQAHCLHVLGGEIRAEAATGAPLGRLSRGQSAIVPVGVGAYRLAADQPGAEVVKVDLPAGTDA